MGLLHIWIWFLFSPIPWDLHSSVILFGYVRKRPMKNASNNITSLCLHFLLMAVVKFLLKIKKLESPIILPFLYTYGDPLYTLLEAPKCLTKSKLKTNCSQWLSSILHSSFVLIRCFLTLLFWLFNLHTYHLTMVSFENLHNIFISFAKRQNNLH